MVKQDRDWHQKEMNVCGAESYQFECIVKRVVMYSIDCRVSINERISILRVSTSLPCCFLSAGKVEAVSPEVHLVKTTPSFKSTVLSGNTKEVSCLGLVTGLHTGLKGTTPRVL